jgi:XTP/dITP diphosphohydrolase
MDTNEHEFTNHLIVATRNPHKTREIQRILGSDFAVGDLFAYPEISETVESGRTFEENAVLKATAASKQLPGLVVADDSGLEVDVLGGAPGIYSARYAGQNAADKQNIDKLLGELSRTGSKEDNRRARFRCILALARDGQILGISQGTVEGTIADQARGEKGFGYDPVFIPEGFEQTFAQLPAEVKDKISHRARAIRSLRAGLDADAADQGPGGGGGAPGGGGGAPG